MNSNAMTSIGQGRCHAENDASGILSLSWWQKNNNDVAIGAYKNGLPLCANQYYTAKAPAKSGVRICTLVNSMATVDADSVFFYVVTSAFPYSAEQIRAESMVALVGQPSGWPVSIEAGSANPVSVTTNHEICTSGGDSKNSMEAATWLLPSPKVRNLSGLSQQFVAIVRQSKPLSTTSQHIQSEKHAAHWREITLPSLPVAFRCRRYAMFNLQTLTAKARELRGNVVKAVSTKGSRTMTPVYDRDEQRKLRERIQQTQPDWVLLWWDIATVTGWRTSDVCNLRYSCVNWETGQATIIVAKQTKAAEARATRKGIEIVRQQRKDAARMAADHIAYMKWDSIGCDELAADMNDEEQAIVFELVAKADVKHDTKQLPPGIIKRLRDRQDRNLVEDDLVFSRSQIESNRCQCLEGSVTRQTIWRKLHDVMQWFTRFINAKLRLSAYSSRKIAAFNLMSAGGEQGLLVASEMLGHSNPAITRTYLQLGSKASAIQSRLAMEVTA